MQVEPIAHIHTPFPTKFGIPRQSGLVEEATGTVVFEPAYRDPDALRGIEGFSHLWLIWGFSEAQREGFSALVRPPRLGGNAKLGVFATRSPYRPNSLGLSSVSLLGVEKTRGKGTVLHVGGVDLMDGTPIYDVKPYIPYSDAHPDAHGGFAREADQGLLRVTCARDIIAALGEDAAAVLHLLERDPRPAYQDDAERVYEVEYDGWSIKFSVAGSELTVKSAALL